MKMHSLKTVVILSAAVVMTASSLFAGNFIERRFKRESNSSSHSEINHCNFTPSQISSFVHEARFALSQVNGNLTALFDMEGTLFRNHVNPFTPETGVLQFLTAINGIGPGSSTQALDDILTLLKTLGVNQNLIAQIANEFTVNIGLAESYAFSVNTLAPLTDQLVIAGAWIVSAQRLGDLFVAAGVTSFVTNPVSGQKDNIKGLLGNLITLQTQLVQAFAAVLDGPNYVGAIPGNLDSQMAAAVALKLQITLLFSEIGELAISDLACPSRDRDADKHHCS